MPNSNKLICEHLLADDVTAKVYDVTSHYFGGYFHVCLLVQADIALNRAWFETEVAFANAVRKLGASVRFERKLEKMAVPDAELAEVRQALLDNFSANVLPYLSGPDFPRRFVLTEYNRAVRKQAPARSFRDA